MIEGVHFDRSWISLQDIGWRAAAAALSDVAAMAGRPLGILLSLGVPEADAGSAVVEVQRGAEALCQEEGVQVLGGDLARSPGPLFLDVVAVGETDQPVLRSGGEEEDELWVTGRLGGSALAVSGWAQGHSPPERARAAFARPRPRLREARWLADHISFKAMVDLSDGLAGDAGHLAAASGLSVVLDAEAIPLHEDFDPSARVGGKALHMALTGGEDYELLFAAAPGSMDPRRDAFEERFGVLLTRVGTLSAGSGVFLATPDGEVRPLEKGGFSHFQGRKNG
jgi:thiamine-monophosphate kinase